MYRISNCYIGTSPMSLVAIIYNRKDMIMTIPIEEVSAIRRTREFLRRIVQDTRRCRTGRNREYFEEALGCLRHYPMEHRVKGLWKPEVEKFNNEIKGA